MPSAVIYVITMWADTTILKEKSKIGNLSFEGFHAKLECKLTCMDGNQNQTANTHIVFIISFSKKKKKRKKKH